MGGRSWLCILATALVCALAGCGGDEETAGASAEVSRIQRSLATTMVYVTHDQTEAMTLGDRVAVMRLGILQQVDTPRNLYNDPRNLFVAGFIGSPAMNFFSGRIDEGHVQLPFGQAPVPQGVEASGDVIVGVRPEDFEDAKFAPQGHEGFEFDAPVDVVESMGSETYVYFSFEGGKVDSAELAELAQDSGVAEAPSAAGGVGSSAVARVSAESELKVGDRARLWMDTNKLHVFDPEDGANLALHA